ncbi:MAG: hypothetical protein EZS28_032409 [Streblomastix strix]|uniref:Uncharacterized protein n=1 Tax=Streblomastix strix TaxID=222440 RepID=A0A5J4UPH3_9EUKA|nr:MAG: hypothetical protein EZS28_032409 [Streblomastix strix]
MQNNQNILLSPTMFANSPTADEDYRQKVQFVDRIKQIKKFGQREPDTLKQQIVNGEILTELTQMLRWAQKKSKKIADAVQARVCKLLLELLTSDEDDITAAFTSGLVKELQKLISSKLQSGNEVKLEHINSLTFISGLANSQRRCEMLQYGIPQTIAPLLRSEDDDQTFKTAVAIFNVIRGGWRSVGQDDRHPHLDVLVGTGVVKSLFEDGIRGKRDQRTSFACAEAIGHLYKDEEVPAAMKEVVVDLLKEAIRLGGNIDFIFSIEALLTLAQSEGNRLEIFKNEKPQSKTIRDIVDNDRLKQLSESSDKFERIHAKMLLAWLQFEEDRRNLSKIIRKAHETKTYEEKQKIATEDSFNQICDALKQMRNIGNYDKTVVFLACEAASLLIKGNKEAVKVAMAHDNLVSELYLLLANLKLKSYQPFHSQAINLLLSASTANQQYLLIKTSAMKAIYAMLDSQYKNVITEAVHIAERVVWAGAALVQFGKTNQVRTQYNSHRIMEKLVSVYRIYKSINPVTSDRAAITLGHYFKAAQLPPEFNREVVESIKQLINSNDLHLCVNPFEFI